MADPTGLHNPDRRAQWDDSIPVDVRLAVVGRALAEGGGQR